MRLILVRHPQPMVEAGICYGRTDLPVSPQQLSLAVTELSSSLPHQLMLYSSPLQRCAQLAVQLATLLESPALAFDARLVEMNFGAWEMRAWDDIPRAEIDAWAADPANYQPGGGESVMQMAARIAAFYADLQRQQTDAIVICHAGAMRLLCACHEGLPLPEIALHAAKTSHKIAYGAVLTLQS